MRVGPTPQNSRNQSFWLYSHVQSEGPNLPPTLEQVLPPRAAMAATAAAIREHTRRDVPRSPLAALLAALHNAGMRGMLPSLAWAVKGLLTTALAIAFNEMLKKSMSDDQAGSREALANLLAAAIGGGLALGTLHARLDRWAGEWLNRCGAATIVVPEGEPLAVFNPCFSFAFSLRSAIIAALVAADKMNFFDTDDDKNQLAIYKNLAITSLISSVLSIPCGYLGVFGGSLAALWKMPAEQRMKALTVRYSGNNEHREPYVENNTPYLARPATEGRAAVSEKNVLDRHNIARGFAGAIAGAVQELLTELLMLHPFLTESRNEGAQIFAKAAVTGIAVQVAVNWGWREMVPRTMAGVLNAMLAVGVAVEGRAAVGGVSRPEAVLSLFDDSVSAVVSRAVRFVSCVHGMFAGSAVAPAQAPVAAMEARPPAVPAPAPPPINIQPASPVAGPSTVRPELMPEPERQRLPLPSLPPTPSASEDSTQASSSHLSEDASLTFLQKLAAAVRTLQQALSSVKERMGVTEAGEAQLHEENRQEREDRMTITEALQVLLDIAVESPGDNGRRPVQRTATTRSSYEGSLPTTDMETLTAMAQGLREELIKLANQYRQLREIQEREHSLQFFS